MVLESSDLQHRRRPAKSGRSKRRSTAGRASTTRRRRRRRSGQNRSAMAATFLCAAVLVSLALLANRRKPKAEAGRPGGGERLLQKFMKKQRMKKAAKWTSPHGVASDAERRLESDEVAEEKARTREGRYNSLYKPKFDASALGYDIYNCPSTPPEDYPKAWTTTEVLGNWNPNEVTTLPPAHRDVYQGLCVFDYQTQYATALSYRNAELPFIIRNDPKVTSVVQRWEDDPEYLHRVLGDVEEFRTERSPNNQFMWYRLRGKRRPPEDKPPNDETEMTFGEWLEHALEKDGKALGDNELIARAAALRERRLGLLPKEEAHEDDPLGNDGNILDEESEEAKREKYYYFRINADLKSAREASPSQFIYDELTFLDPRKRRDSELYIVDPKQERGINCRFGMRGVTAVNHFDMSRNVIALFGGERRYVLASPSQCSKMALHPPGHPSLRHSSVDWTNPADWENHPEFKEARVNEVVLHAGDVLYLPTNWFHFIVNLSVNYQCNARSGTTHETAHFIEQCGFAQH